MSTELEPLTADDIPPVCWLKCPHGEKTSYALVLWVNDGGLGYSDVALTFTTLAQDGWQMSTDRKTWQPCAKPKRKLLEYWCNVYPSNTFGGITGVPVVSYHNNKKDAEDAVDESTALRTAVHMREVP